MKKAVKKQPSMESKLAPLLEKYDDLRADIDKLADVEKKQGGLSDIQARNLDDLTRRALASERSIRQEIDTLCTIGHDRGPLQRVTAVEPPEAWWPVAYYAIPGL